MSRRIVEQVQKLIAPAIADLGYDLVDVEYKRESQGMVLTVYIDKHGGVSLDDCEHVSSAIDPVLDQHDPIPDSYYLSVSSPGLDRPLKTNADFDRHIGNSVDIRLYKAIDKKKTFTGVLASYDKDVVTITIDGSAQAFNRADIGSIKPHIEF
mgnify:CR=1 FL=1